MNKKYLIIISSILLMTSKSHASNVDNVITESVINNNQSVQLHNYNSNIYDPYENFNRSIFAFNMQFDKKFFRYVTLGYIAAVPIPAQDVIQNFFQNLRDFVNFGNYILQLKAKSSMETFMRITLNSTFGMLGMIDVASALGLPFKSNTFGDTFKVYGWHTSSYIMLPFLGPSTIRDAIGLPPTIMFNPTWYLIDDYRISFLLFTTNLIQQRAELLIYDQILDTSLDPYLTIRTYYLKSINQEESISQINDMSIDDILSDE